MITIQLDAVGFEIVRADANVVVVVFEDPLSKIKVVVPFTGDSWDRLRQKILAVDAGVEIVPAGALDQIRRVNGNA